jgi:hypothetical protein
VTVKAGDIITVGGQTVLQRLQNQGLTNAKVPISTIREIGDSLVVDKIPQEPDFTFSLESLAVDCSIEAILHGEVSTGPAPTQGAGYADAAGTSYPWESSQAITIISPWKDPESYGSGTVQAGHIIPGYFPSKMSYKFGVTEDSGETCELRGGQFYYAAHAPTEDVFTGNGTQIAFVTTEPAIQYRVGGVAGTTFENVLGVLVGGVWQVPGGEDYTITGGGPASGASVATVTFKVAPPTGHQVRIAYFTTNAHAYPTSVHESALVMPGAVRGRNIALSVSVINTDGSFGAWQRVYGVQTATLDASFDIAPERELANEELTGFTVNGTDCTGQITLHARDAPAFFTFLGQMTGLDTANEVVGWLNLNPLRIKIEIQNPSNPGAVLKTLYVADARFDIPATPARVNAVVDFSLGWESITGTYVAYKGATSV